MRLQLSRPVIELGEHQIGAVGQAAFSIEFAVSLMIQAPERRSQPAQGEDQTELCSAALDDEAKRTRLANARPFSHSFCTFASGSPAARQTVTVSSSHSAVRDSIEKMSR